MSYNADYAEEKVKELQVWLEENPGESIKSFTELNNLNYTNFRRYLSRVGYARYPNKKSKITTKVAFIAFKESDYFKLQSKAKKKGIPMSTYLRDLALKS